MRREIALGMLLACGGIAWAGAAFQAQQPPGVKVPDIVKVRDNLYVIGGANPNAQEEFSGGNTAVFVTTKGVVVVDTKFAGWGKMILDKIKSVTDRPVTTIINTHTHFDHSGSNTEFPATRRVRRSREHPCEHGERHLRAGHQLRRLQGRQRQVPAQTHLPGQDVAVQRRRPDRPLPFRPRAIPTATPSWCSQPPA